MRKGRLFLISVLCLCVLIVIYTIWDNNRIKVVEKDIEIKGLPREFEGFKILQISDLHEKTFGEKQENLIRKVNSINYDVITLTGDLLGSPDSGNYSPVYDLLDGINHKKHMLFVPGNTDPIPYVVNSDQTISKNPFLKGMEDRGVTLLDHVYPFNRENTSIYFVNFDLSYLKSSNLLDNLEKDDLLVALNHYPVVDKRIEQLHADPYLYNSEYDLILAGHYHGGQIRLPLFGALFVPEAWYERNGLFPPQDRVKGLWQYINTKQYVSAGLGSSHAIPFLAFRFLNTPEINVLTLKRK